MDLHLLQRTLMQNWFSCKHLLIATTSPAGPQLIRPLQLFGYLVGPTSQLSDPSSISILYGLPDGPIESFEILRSNISEETSSPSGCANGKSVLLLPSSLHSE